MKSSFSRWRLMTLGAMALPCLPLNALAIPVIPGAAGFGIETPAGRGGAIYRVTNLNSAGEGSLRACVDATGPRVCVFETSGVIRLDADLSIRNPYLTIAGQTAPSPGIMLRGAGLRVSASNVLVQHIRVRVGDDSTGPAPANRDALKIESPAAQPVSNIVIDHCSFSWSVDEVASIWEGARQITLRNNVFSEPLNESIHPSDSGGVEPHGYGVILGPADNNVGDITLVGNLMAHQVSRNPLAYSSFVMVNNVVYNHGDVDVMVANRGVPTASAIVGNVFVRGPSSVGTIRPVYVRGGSGVDVVQSGTKVYLFDNQSQGSVAADPWSNAWVQAPVNLSSVYTNSAPLWPKGLVAQPASGDIVLGAVLQQAGARPADRDSVDSRIVSQVRSRTGAIINCVAADGSSRCALNAGGWPSMVQRTRALSVPANPEVAGSDGYTNLEKWLQRMAAEIEGRADVPTPPFNTQLL
jgi:hypothetical protein